MRLYRGEWPRLLVAVALLSVSTAAGLLKPWPLAKLVDGWTQSPPDSKTPDFTVRWVAALGGLYAVHALTGALLNLILVETGLRGLRRIRCTLFEWVLSLSLSRLRACKVGDLLYRATWDTYAFQTLFHQGLFTGLTASASLVAMSVVMFRLNSTLALVALATVVPLAVIMRSFAVGIGGRTEAAQKSDSGLASRFEQAVYHLPLLQIFTAETREAAAFESAANGAFAARRRQHRFELGYLAAIGVVFAVGTAAIVWFGGREVRAGSLSLGTFLVFLAYLAQFYDPLQQISNVGTTVGNAATGAKRVLELLDQPQEPAPPLEPVPLPTAHPQGRRIEFRDVRFGYSPGVPVFQSLTLVVEPGQSIAIVGPSGAGKSTLLHLIPRFMDPDSGVVLVDNVDVKRLGLRDLRAAISWVPQEPILLPGTVAENIAFGRPDASMEAIREAAEAAHADGFIRRLADGYETVVGDGAVRLSVGERQRLNLARAYLSKRPILLMDEPTSALDPESEHLVMKALETIKVGRTLIMVAHRSDTVRIVERTVRIERGAATEMR